MDTSLEKMGKLSTAFKKGARLRQGMPPASTMPLPPS